MEGGEGCVCVCVYVSVYFTCVFLSSEELRLMEGGGGEMGRKDLCLSIVWEEEGGG